MQDRLGSSLRFTMALGIIFLALSACTPIYKCKLLNATTEPISVIGGRAPVHLHPGEVKLVTSVTNELRLVRGERILRFSLTKVPEKHVRAKPSGWIIYAVLTDDNHLYLGKPAARGAVVSLEVQPSPFPLSPHPPP